MESNRYAPPKTAVSSGRHCTASWNGVSIQVTARTVPRYLFTTASIDVMVDGRQVIGTGGVLKRTGSHQVSFQIGNLSHRATLSWGVGSPASFPFRLQIDEALVLEGRVPTKNWWLGLWPWTVAVALGILAAAWMH